MSNNCPNCGICLCTGALLTRAKDGSLCCTKCSKAVNDEINAYLKLNPHVDINTLKRMRKNNPK